MRQERTPREHVMGDCLRRLNADGIGAFVRYLEDLKSGLTPASISACLTDPSTSIPLEPTIEIEKRIFASRYELGEYLVELLAPLDRRQISRDHGLWTWLALYYLDQLIPPGLPSQAISA